jgi:hypothetical protein
MSSQSGRAHLLVPMIIRSQNEVRKAIEVLYALSASADAGFWTEDMRENYHRAIDELTSLESSLYSYRLSILPHSLDGNGDGDGSHDGVTL